MRDIRFRAWDGKKMYNPKEVNKWRVLDLNKMQGEEAVMQYTGLKDKNGKEIFEGDLLQYWQAAGGSTKYKLDSRLRTVRWNEKGSVVGFNIGAARSRNGGTPTMNWEIVGNIYQNPELVK